VPLPPKLVDELRRWGEGTGRNHLVILKDSGGSQYRALNGERVAEDVSDARCSKSLGNEKITLEDVGMTDQEGAVNHADLPDGNLDPGKSYWCSKPPVGTTNLTPKHGGARFSAGLPSRRRSLTTSNLQRNGVVTTKLQKMPFRLSLYIWPVGGALNFPFASRQHTHPRPRLLTFRALCK